MNSVKFRIVLKVSALIVMICFFLPFFTVSCSGYRVNITGVTMIAGILDSELSGIYEGNPIASIFFILPAAAASVAFVMRSNKNTGRLVTLFMGIDVIALFVLKQRVCNIVWDKMGFEWGYDISSFVQTRIGYHGSLLFGIICLVTAILFWVAAEKGKLDTGMGWQDSAKSLLEPILNSGKEVLANVSSGPPGSQRAASGDSSGVQDGAAEHPAFCSNCGMKLEAGALFCSGCGTPVEQSFKS